MTTMSSRCARLSRPEIFYTVDHFGAHKTISAQEISTRDELLGRNGELTDGTRFMSMDFNKSIHTRHFEEFMHLSLCIS